MSKVAIEKIVKLLGKLQERLTRVGNESAQTRDTLAAFQDEVRVSDIAFKTAIIQLKSGQETLLSRIQEAEFKNNKREEAQTLRDQNNVQALVNLRESTKKAFDQVAGDVKSLLTAVQRLNERVGQVESQNLSLVSTVSLLRNRIDTPAPAPTPPFDHVWVNKKLTSVYAVTEELEARIQKLETPAPPAVLRKPFRLVQAYMGYAVGILDNIVFIGEEKFTFSENIRGAAVFPYGVLVTIKRGDQYLICGGPSPASMYVNLFKKA